MKSIVYTVTSLRNSGGIERVLINKANWLTERGYRVSIITEKTTDSFYKVDSRIQICSLGIDKRSFRCPILSFFAYILFCVRYWFKISNLLETITPEIVISANANDFLVLPFVYKRSKKIYEFHWIVSPRNRDKESIKERISKKLMDVIGNKYDNIILLTSKDKEHMGNRWKNVKVIPNGCPFTCDVPASLVNNRAIAIGNLFHIKGFSRLIDVWSLVHKRFPNFSLSIYGDGYLKEELQSKINDLSLSDVVKLEGRVSNIKECLSASSLVLVSSYEESFSMVILEAHTCGLPVVSFDCPFGPSEIITDGVDGFLIPNDNLEDFANKICLLIENEKLRKDMGNMAYHNSKRFAEEKVMPMWVHLFDE